ncbi:hypothetical protein CUJ83_09200 [Methanocella sp. CWC-04]|uniref:DUF362 domain-containing protein n=1 Tax=Methanooceanicella nereidis TaxID=2052831 RepID=A0AAP2RD08_9EURY|nr:DUF362 domain-containing protein [Methanocella sp. CWC-04]MCD1295173.1 hypothetical protein [Methanocella sp. CWC-04]
MKFDVVAISKEYPKLGTAAYNNTMEALIMLEQDGQLDNLMLDGKVMIKPNFTQPPNPSLKFGPRKTDLTVHNHVCTDPFSIKAACDFILEHGGEVFVAESTKWPGETQGVFLHQGCETLLEEIDVKLFDLLTNSQEERAVVYPSRVWNEDFAEIEVNKKYTEVNVIINMAKLKSHSNSLVTGCIKNMYGALEPANRRSEGHYCADPLWADISRRDMARGYKLLCETFVQVHDAVFRHIGIDEICVIEGIISGEGDGPLYKPAMPRQENIIMASVNNPATIDAAESYYMGFSPDFLRSYAEYRLMELDHIPDEEFLDSYADQYFLKLGEEDGMGKIRGFDVFAISSKVEEIIPGENLGLLRRGPVFELPTFVKYAANTPMYEKIPDGGHQFRVEAAA